MQCGVTRCIICISNKAENMDKERIYKILQKKQVRYMVISSYFSN